ncbi:hypothetical protein PG997_014944 [Apiospora hydei]|uniref:Uncharacterized protein n=1 Tax=Apiospora hydei TaxID=1337664 RepID=A0ABR1UVC8_9PEZI
MTSTPSTPTSGPTGLKPRGEINQQAVVVGFVGGILALSILVSIAALVWTRKKRRQQGPELRGPYGV